MPSCKCTKAFIFLLMHFMISDDISFSRRYPFSAMLIQDDHGQGVPVACYLGDQERSDEIKLFVEHVLQAAKKIHSAFTVSNFMIDKSKAEIKAVIDLGYNYYLCKFHVLQDWERFLRSSKAGVPKVDQGKIIHEIIKLIEIDDKAVFCKVEEQFLGKWTHYTSVTDYYKKEWAGCAHHWAFFGRGDILQMRCNTNNLLERYFGKVKYQYCEGRRIGRLSDFLTIYVEKILPSYLHDRLRKDAGRMESKGSRAIRHRNHRVDVIEKTVVVVNAEMGTGRVHSFSSLQEGKRITYDVCLGDLSCSCAGNEHGLCVHVEALSRHTPFTHNLRVKYSSLLGEQGALKTLDATNMIVTCAARANTPAVLYCNVLEKYCSCNDWGLHGICCHMLAARVMFRNQGMQLPELQPTVEEVGECDQPIPLSASITLGHHVHVNPDSEVEDPVCIAKDELAKLKVVATGAREEVEQDIKETNDLLSDIRQILSTIPQDARREFRNLLKAGADKFRGCRVAPAKTQRQVSKTEKKRHSRQDSDLIHKPLYQRTKSPRPPSQDTAQEVLPAPADVDLAATTSDLPPSASANALAMATEDNPNEAVVEPTQRPSSSRVVTLKGVPPRGRPPKGVRGVAGRRLNRTSRKGTAPKRLKTVLKANTADSS